MWTFALTVTGLGGLWLVARHWQGWILYLINELLWLVYGVSTGQHPVIVMAVLWFILGARNLVVTRRSQRELVTTSHLQAVQSAVLQEGQRYGANAGEVRPLPVESGEARALREYREHWHPY